MTDRFFDGNARNNPDRSLFDPTCTQLRLYCGGDWQGIIDKINDGYLSNTGITAIRISPPVENIYSLLSYPYDPLSTSYHGFWARDFKKQNPFFGNFTDFENLIKAAHAHGIKVVIDFAPNHTSPVKEDDPTFGENGRLYDNGKLLGSYQFDPKRLYHHYGSTDFTTMEDMIYRNLADLADLNHNNSRIDRYFKDAINIWLGKGVDAIRVDTVKHLPQGWLTSWTQNVYNHKPVFMFGEWLMSPNGLDPDNIKFANESGMSVLDFHFANTVRNVFRDRTATMRELDAMLGESKQAYHNLNDLATFIDNHDIPRFQQPEADRRRLEQALTFLLTSRGVPIVYYGTEQYMIGGEDPNNRQKMTSFAPVIGHVGPMMAIPGASITIDGRGFGEDKGSVYFGETAVKGDKVWKDLSISITVPKLPDGKYSIRVRTADGVFSKSYGNFKMLTGPQTAVRFVVRQARNDPGEKIYLVGNVSELGNWNPDHVIGRCSIESYTPIRLGITM